MDSEFVTAYRDKIRQHLGDAFASKASDELCTRLAVDTLPTVRQSGNKTVKWDTPVIVETIDVLNLQPEAGQISVDDWLKDDIEHMIGFRDRKGSMPDISRRFRRAYALAWKSAVLQKINRIREELVDRFPKNLPPDPMHSISWPNACIRTAAPLGWLAEVAHDPLISLIDLPRLLDREIVVTGESTRAVEFRSNNSLSGEGIIVGIVDGEIHANHPAFQDRVVQMEDYTGEGWGHPDWHATAVAGIVGSGDAIFRGMAPSATLYNYKIFPSAKIPTDDFPGAVGIGRAIDDGVHIINLSWGSEPIRKRKCREARVCDTAWVAGVTVVKSAGNRGATPNQLTMPAEADGIIVVGATDRECTSVASYSSGGPVNPKDRQKPHLVAPGGTEEDGIVSCDIEGGFSNTAFGTSFAAPHISGLVALLLERQALSPDEVRNFLIEKCCAFLPGHRPWEQGAGAIRML